MTDILAIGSHPDDIEFYCGAILAKMASQGKKIVMIDLTSGEKGSNGTPEGRREEATNAASIINAKREFLNFSDCAIFDSYEGRLELVKVIRKYKPRLVIAPMWKGVQNHPDHTATGLMVRHACRYSRLAKILPELPIHLPEGILHYAHHSSDLPDFLVDVTEHVDTWKKMIDCHVSQMKTFDYADWCLRGSAKQGMLMGVPHAQGLIKGNPIVIDDIMQIAKSSREI